MKTKLKYLIPFLALTACTENKETETVPAPLFPQPRVNQLNNEDGYLLNSISGDTIPLIILESGDTLITGIPIPAKGKTINPNSVAQPKAVPLITPTGIYDTHPNVYKIPNELTTIHVNNDSLTKIIVSEIAKNDTLHFLINSTGDTIRTGLPIPITGKVVPLNQPKATKALAPRFKDAANSNLQYLDVDQGMASSSISAILEDKNRNIWFGTLGGGISRYDGESFMHFTEDEGLSHNTITSIIEDKSGNIWIGTYGGGVSRYDGKSFTHFTEKEGFSNNNVWSILEDTYGNIWFGTFGGGVSQYDGKYFTHFTEKEGLSSNTVNTILEDKNGNLWFGTHNGGVSCYDGNRVDAINSGKEMTERDRQDLNMNDGKLVKSFVHFTEKEGLSNNSVTSILEDKNGNLWFGTLRNGATRYDGKSFTHFTEKEGLANNIVKSILEDKYGNIWFGTLGGGVSRYDGNSFMHFTEKEGLSSNKVWSILEDKYGNIWFGTLHGGVTRYKEKSFTHFTEKGGLSNNIVKSILEDKNGNLWFGTYGGGVTYYDGESFTHFTEKEGLSDNNLWSIIEDRNGNIWFGTYDGGVCRYDGNRIDAINNGKEMTERDRQDLNIINGKLVKSFTHFTEDEGLSNNIVKSILEDRNGNLWFGTLGGGVNRYDGKSFTHFTEKEGLSNNTVNSILEDKNGIFWFGTLGGGVSRYDGKSFTHFTEKEGLSSNSVNSILEDKNGNLWFGTTGGGVNCYDGKSFTHFTEKEGLSNNDVNSILEDNDGNLWFGTQNGLSMLKQENLALINKKSNTLLFNTFEKSDGLKGLDFSNNSAYLDSKNRIWWGNSKSLTMLDINKYSANQKPPAVYLKQLEINEQNIDYRNITDSLAEKIDFSGVQHFENYPLNLKLPFNKNHLTFHFAAIDWSAPHKIQYSYMMEGLNDNWSKPSHDTKADYRNLPYGTYKFQVKAIGESGEWSKAFEYEFTIHPPWWHTWWARLGYSILGIVFILLIIRWRTSKLKQRQNELETEVANATIEIHNEKAKVEETLTEVEKQKEKSEELLLNILPVEVAEELKEKGSADAQLIDFVSVLFTDFKGFTALSETLSPKELVKEINHCFSAFDHIMEKHNVEKIKTIGDAYMAAGGLPTANKTHALDVVKAAIEIQNFMLNLAIQKKANNEPVFEIRIGVHTGPVVAGIVGVKKFQYDIWGDTVNTASRMESSGEVGKVNISQATYDLLKDIPGYEFESRGKIEAKGKGEIEMYFVSKN